MPTYKLLPNHIQLVNISEELKLFFHVPSLQIYPLTDKRIITFLERYVKYGYKKTKIKYPTTEFNEFYDFICNTIKAGPPLTNMTIMDITKEDFNAIVLPIAAACNLDCPYCFAQTDGGFKFGNFTEKDIESIVTFLIKNRSNSSDPLTIIFFGGEPLLNLNIIKFTIQLFKERYSDYKVHYSITTNGTLIDDEIVRIFKENNFSVLVSLDGYENEFNLRKFRNGNSSVNTVISNLNILKRNEIDIEIRATLVNNNPYIVDTFDFFERLEVPFKVVFAYASSNKSHHYADYNAENLNLIKEQFDHLLDYYIRKLQCKQKLYNKMFEEIARVFRFRVNYQLVCSAGVNFFTITAKGDIYSCAHLMNDSQFKIGDIFQGIIDKTNYVALPVEQIESCKNCWAKYLCLGSCFSQKIATGGSNKSAKEKYECELERLKWILYMKLYYFFNKLAPEYFRKDKDKN